jgi:hypothetical protein
MIRGLGETCLRKKPEAKNLVTLGVYLVQVSLLLMSHQGFGHIFQESTLASHWLEDCVNFYANAGGK